MELELKWYNRNYVVWDKVASIDFIKPGVSKVSAQFKLTDKIIDEIFEHTKSGEKYLPTFNVNIFDEKGMVIAKVHKTLYIRKRPLRKTI